MAASNLASLLDEINALTARTDTQPRGMDVPRLPTYTAQDTVPENGLRLPEPSGMAGFWERVGQGGGQPFGHVPFVTGARTNPLTGRSRNSSPLLALLAVAAGYANAKARAGLTAKAQRDLFARQQDGQVEDRKTLRDAAFKQAGEHAKAVREQRTKQMRAAVDHYVSLADAADARARGASGTAQRNHEASRDVALQRAAAVEADLAKLEGRTPRDLTPAPLLSRADKPPRIRGTVEPKGKAAPAPAPLIDANGQPTGNPFRPGGTATPGEKPKKPSKKLQTVIDYMRTSQGITTRAQAQEYLSHPKAAAGIKSMAADGITVDQVLSQFQ